MKFEYAYAVTCERHDGTDMRVSGACYHKFENALKFIENRSDKPEKTENPMIWKGEKYIYKIVSLTFDDAENNEVRKMRTARGQAARIIRAENGYVIELYANGEWGSPASCYESTFETEEQAFKYFISKKQSIHS